MKRVLLFVFWVSVTILLEGCTTQRTLSSQDQQRYVDEVQKIADAKRDYSNAFVFVSLTAKAESVKICFKAGESPFYEPYTLTNRFVYVDFFDDECSEDGRVNDYRWSVRTFLIAIPEGEKVEKVDYKGIITTRADGTKHYIKFVLVNRPKY